MVRKCALFLLAIVLPVLAACGEVMSAPGSTLGPCEATASVTVRPTVPATPKSVDLLGQVAREPEKYLGQVITVEGALEAKGEFMAWRFFLRNAAGEGLEVTAWAPFEVVQPPDGGPAPKVMSDFVGHRLRLTGTLEKQGEGVILVVSSYEEL